LALNQTDEAATWLGHFRSGLHKLRTEGVRPMGVDLVSDEAQNIVQANIGVAAMRAGAMEKAQLQAAQEAQQARLEPGAAPAAIPAFPAAVSESQPTRLCPYCGQAVRPQAKFCSSCGHSLV
jgi:membrane protease subunit (stomatin/prohibitin family)